MNEFRAFNFSAGPACLPDEVLKKAQQEMLNCEGSGMSVMEMSHRGEHFTRIFNNAKKNLKQILEIPDNYKILFLAGGATALFSAIPLNLGTIGDTADYICTGAWSQKAIEEARKFIQVNVAASNEQIKFGSIPLTNEWKLTPTAKYVYYCDNETIHGIEFKEIPQTKAPLVCDASSSFLSKPIDVSKFGIIFAGAQKNCGIAGVTIVIIREDLLDFAKSPIPSCLDLKFKSDHDSMDNTPPTFGIYVAGLVFEWILRQGGLKGISQRNEEKASIIYQAIDSSNGFYNCPVEKKYRSRMNIPFRIRNGDANLESQFLKDAESHHMLELKGHRSVGGIRVSLYNALTIQKVEALEKFMHQFFEKNK